MEAEKNLEILRKILTKSIRERIIPKSDKGSLKMSKTEDLQSFNQKEYETDTLRVKRLQGSFGMKFALKEVGNASPNVTQRAEHRQNVINQSKSGKNIPFLASMSPLPGSITDTDVKFLKQTQLSPERSSGMFKTQGVEMMKRRSPKHKRSVKKKPKIDIFGKNSPNLKSRRRYRNTKSQMNKTNEKVFLPEISVIPNQESDYTKADTKKSTETLGNNIKAHSNTRRAMSRAKHSNKNPDVVLEVKPSPKKQRQRASSIIGNRNTNSGRKSPEGKVMQQPFMERTRNNERYHLNIRSPQGNKISTPLKAEPKTHHIFKPGVNDHDLEDNLLDYEFDDESLIKHPRDHNLYS